MNNLRITYTDGYVEPQLSRKDLHDLAPLVAGLAVQRHRTGGPAFGITLDFTKPSNCRLLLGALGIVET